MVEPMTVEQARAFVAKADAEAAAVARDAEQTRDKAERTAFEKSPLYLQIGMVLATGGAHPSLAEAVRHIADVRALFGASEDPRSITPQQVARRKVELAKLSTI